MSEDVDWTEVKVLLDDLYTATDRLEFLFPGRKFTPDGHLVGSIGEVIAAYIFNLDLLPCSSLGHDATAADGRKVEVKLTQGAAIAIRHRPEHLVALRRIKGEKVEVVFNGPGDMPWEAAGEMGSYGQRRLGIARLRSLDQAIPDEQKLRVVRAAAV